MVSPSQPVQVNRTYTDLLRVFHSFRIVRVSFRSHRVVCIPFPLNWRLFWDRPHLEPLLTEVGPKRALQSPFFQVLEVRRKVLRNKVFLVFRLPQHSHRVTRVWPV